MGIRKLMDPCVLGGGLPDPDALSCRMELCGCVPVGGTSGEDGILGPKIGVPLFPSETSKSSSEKRVWLLELEPKLRLDCAEVVNNMNSF
jgi:hypothetical protein